jgi:hypothetical protein
MYVIVCDTRPDYLIENEDYMCEVIENSTNSRAFKYVKVQDVWVVTKMYCMEDGDLVVYPTGKWNCPLGYETYKFPNPCSHCGNTQFMTGDWCMLCGGEYDDHRCPDCDKVGGCHCAYTDF